MIRRRLDPERHGSAGFTSLTRIAALGLVVGFFALGTQLGVKTWYDGRLLPGVKIAGVPVGGLSVPDARKLVRRMADTYRVKLNVANEHYVLSAPQLGVTFDIEGTLRTAYRTGRDGWLPPAVQPPVPLSYHLDRAQLNTFTASVVNKVGTPPLDAGIVISGTDLSTKPEKSGFSIDRLGLQRLIEDDVKSPGGSNLTLKPRVQLADIQVNALGPTVDEARRLMAVPIVLTYEDRTFTPTPSDIGQWLAFQKQPDGTAYKLVPQVDTAKLKSYTQSIANKLEIAAIPQLVNIENGVSKVTQEGSDGLAIDQDALTRAISDAVTREQPLTYPISTRVVPFKTLTTTFVTLDYPKYIEVSLGKQHLWAWENGQIVYESPITSGATGAGLGTVTGLFSIYYKTTNTHLVGYQYGYDYDVPVKYWMPFYQGYGLHDATWRHGNFGGPDYWYGGSHGCVNLPDATAEFIYNWAPVGTPVWVHK
jgi:lipoprotein-anchoring transpeptidase ErfK/SrfK